MILAWLIIIPLTGGVLSFLLGRLNVLWPRLISLVALGIDFLLVLTLMPLLPGQSEAINKGFWLVDAAWEWIPQWGITLHLALDGLSLLMVLLALFLGIISVACSWTEIRERVGFFHLNLLWTLSGILGVFLALDLILLYLFWELMLVPMYFLIALWGHENRVFASVKFFIFTQLSGLFMLAAILGLYFTHGRNTGVYTFDYLMLVGTTMTPTVSLWLMLGFFIAFAVKLPVVPFHTWLPDAHTEAPTAGSVILAGLLLKTGAYGLLRFMVPLFPDAVGRVAPLGMALAVVGIIYGAVLAFAQTDLKRLIAYTSISHMGFVLLGLFAWNDLAIRGAVMQMLCHGISTGALFIMTGALQERLETRDMDYMGGFWATMPRMGGMGLVFALSSLGLPGTGNFIGEFLVLLGSFRTNIPATVLATAGLIAAMIYSLWIIQRVFHGPIREDRKLNDLSMREMSILAVMAAAIVILGLYPQPVFNTAGHSLTSLEQQVSFHQARGSDSDKIMGSGANQEDEP